MHIVYIYNGILLSHKKENNAICSNTNGPREIIISEVNQKDKYHMLSRILEKAVAPHSSLENPMDGGAW